MTAKQDKQLIDFVERTTQAITVISEATKQNAETAGALKEMISSVKTSQEVSFKEVNGKMDGILTMFKWVIVPLIAGILGLVGVKMLGGI